MQNIIVDPEFQNKIPRLSEEEFSGLREDILADGYVRDPLTVWEETNTLLDGHNRWKIIAENWDLLKDRFQIDYRSFPNRWAAVAWICRNQRNRHNLNELQKAKLLQEEHDAIVKSRGGDYGNQYTTASGQNVQKAEKTDTRKEIADEHGVTPGYVKHSVEFGRGLDAVDVVSPGTAEKVLSGETKVVKAEIAEARKHTPEEIADAMEVDDNKVRFHFPKTDNRGKGSYSELREIEEMDAAHYGAEKVPEYTVDDLLEEVQTLQQDFIDKFHTLLDIRRDVATDTKEARRKVLAEIKNLENEIKNIKEILQ